jgi:hypothetical protein
MRDVTGKRTTQLRGGTGIFTGKPAYVCRLLGEYARSSTLPGLVPRSELAQDWHNVVPLFSQYQTLGNASYAYSGDLNGDGSTTYDLIYIPRNESEMNFQQYTQGTGTSAVTFTAQQQADAWEKYIEQDAYLRSHRGEYAQRVR